MIQYDSASSSLGRSRKKNHTELVCFWSLLKRYQRISKKPYWTYLLNTLHGQLRLQSHRPLHAWCMCELDQVMRKSETRLRWIFRCRKSRSFANFYFNRKVSMGTTPPTHTRRGARVKKLSSACQNLSTINIKMDNCRGSCNRKRWLTVDGVTHSQTPTFWL